MQYYYHEHLSDLDENGFGLLYLTTANAHMPPHWHRAIEILYILSGTACVKDGGRTERLKAGDLYLIDSYQIHESWSNANITYLCVHVLPTQMSKYVPNFYELRFSLQHTPDDLEKQRHFPH